MIRIVVVDDHMMVRAGLSQLLSTVPDIELVGIATDGLEGLEVVLREKPDVVLMDLSMPNLDGVEATARITARLPECKVLVLTRSATSVVSPRRSLLAPTATCSSTPSPTRSWQQSARSTSASHRLTPRLPA